MSQVWAASQSLCLGPRAGLRTGRPERKLWSQVSCAGVGFVLILDILRDRDTEAQRGVGSCSRSPGKQHSQPAGDRQTHLLTMGLHPGTRDGSAWRQLTQGRRMANCPQERRGSKLTAWRVLGWQKEEEAEGGTSPAQLRWRLGPRGLCQTPAPTQGERV